MLLALAGGMAVLFATASRPERRIPRFGVAPTALAACYSITWTDHTTPVVARTPCAPVNAPGAPPPTAVVTQSG